MISPSFKGSEGSEGSKGSQGSEGFSNEPINASVIISFGAPKNL